MTARMDTWTLWVSAGQGPFEAREFASLLAEHLARACEDAGLERLDHGVQLDYSISSHWRGDRSVVAGLLGTHALIHDSRRAREGRCRGHRKRWFVHVGTCSLASTGASAALDEADVEWQFTCAGGPGGQHVNKTATAVRAVHRPSGVAVRVCEARSQAHNRKLALERLASKLHERGVIARGMAEREDRERRRALVRGEPVAVWRLDGRRGLVVIG